MTDDYITDHPYVPSPHGDCGYAVEIGGRGASGEFQPCAEPASAHADPRGGGPHLIDQYPHDYVPPTGPAGALVLGDHCAFVAEGRTCGYPKEEHRMQVPHSLGAVVRMADVAQYAREPMPDAARRGIQVTLIDAPVDPLGTMAVIGGIYQGEVRRSKSDVTDEQRRQMLADMQATVLNGPLECIQFTFLVEGVDRAITHQMVRSRFSFFAQESLRFAVAEDWAQEVPLPPSLAGLPDDSPAVGVWLRALNQAEDNYAALIGAGMPAEEARGLLPHAITTRLYWAVSLRTLLMEAGKRTCTQAQFPWRVLFGGVAKALRERGRNYAAPSYDISTPGVSMTRTDGWQYKAFADLLRPVCYQQGSCGFMAQFDRGCTIRERVDANEKAGRPSSEWHLPASINSGPGTYSGIPAIDPREWAADPAAARVVE